MLKSWLPNGLSMGNLTFGFFSILVSSHVTPYHEKAPQTFLLAGLLIMIAAILDGIDGPIARKLDSQSSLGKELDTLADLTTFGLAPGALIYRMYLSDLMIPLNFKDIEASLPIGLAIAAIFPLCAAYRLARFNTENDPKSFTGLPSPVAGLFIAFLPVSLYNGQPIPKIPALIVFVLMGALMVSNIKYSKPQVTLKPHFTILRLMAFTILVSALMWWLGWYWVVFFVVVLYIFSGLIALFIHLLQKIRVGIGENILNRQKK